MLLPVTDITLPSADFQLRKFKEAKNMSEETMAFTAELVHVPTKYVFYVKNDGRGGCHFYDGDHTHKGHAQAQNAWLDFCEASLPALKDSNAKNAPDFMQDFYDKVEPADMRDRPDEVLDLFLIEAATQGDLSRKRGTVVRKQASDQEFSIYKAKPEELKGRVQGEYWDKASKNWIAL